MLHKMATILAEKYGGLAGEKANQIMAGTGIVCRNMKLVDIRDIKQCGNNVFI